MSELDDLLQPTVTPAEKRPLPWRVSSQFWVAFLGGVPAVTLIAYLNAGRLGMSASQRRSIVGAGIVAFAMTIFAMVLMAEENRTMVRLAVRVLAVLLYLVFARVQRDDDGRHQVFGSGTYASLWAPGGFAIVLGWIVTLIVAVPVVLLTR